MNSLSYFNGNSVSLSNTNLLLLCICNLRWLWGLNSAVYSSSTQHCSLLLLMAFPTSVINIFQSIFLILCFVTILLCNATIQLTLFLFLTSLIILEFIYHLHISPLHCVLLQCLQKFGRSLTVSELRISLCIPSYTFSLFPCVPSASGNHLPPLRFRFFGAGLSLL